MALGEPGPENWIEHVLKIKLCNVVFVGQNYWAHKLILRGSNYVGLLRNNLHRYKLDSIYFVYFRDKNTLLYCDKRTFSLIIPNLKYIQEIEAIEVAERNPDADREYSNFLNSLICLTKGRLLQKRKTAQESIRIYPQ
jgi:hypothetical protein